MIFLDPNQSDSISKKFVNHVLKTCFQLFEVRTKAASSGGAQGSSLSQAGPNFGNSVVRSTLQASLKQLFTLVFEVFNQKTREILGEDEMKDAMPAENGQFPIIAQVFQEREDSF
jgi:hypothetical protein